MQSQLVVFSLDYQITCMYKEKETRIILVCSHAKEGKTGEFFVYIRPEYFIF